ncbi:MAG: cyclomaltodextrinase C-terminal domain-containing protein [Paludibacteraceae bacterium]|nr:cyclomaltodextrinase C-terminal domain-containing protein [Paludibacteraceae bacterium]
MKKLFLFAIAAVSLLSCTKQKPHVPTLENADPQISRVEPLSWWADMRTPLTLMFYGNDLQDARVSVEELQVIGTDDRTGDDVLGNPHSTSGIRIKGQHNAESKNYLFVDVEVNKSGNYLFTIEQGDKTAQWTYRIDERRKDSRERTSFTSADVVYLIMSDRFVDGDPTNNSTDNTLEKGDKQNMDGRWGGDIQGIINSLDHISKLGATAIWPTPLLLDNEPAWSYHGYACGDYYHIDPRFGTNELYKQMVAAAHEKGLKFIMDIVTNHSGLAHWWMQDLPYHDWIHQYPEFTRTNNVFTANHDPNASQYDLKLNESGWFDTHMPDMNLDNPDLLQYFKQFAIWWIEYADLDGLRVDTYPYNEKLPMSEWCKAVREEYPNMNIVGECWTRPASNVAYWQAGAPNLDGFNSNLPAVMDFPTEEAIRQALENDGNFWGGGLTRVYDAIAQDFLYANVNNLLVFVGNHDMDRIADVVKDNDPRRVKLALTMIATMRGIPQLFAGDEYGMRSADITRGHSGLRQPLPEADKLTDAERDMFDYQSRLFQFRKQEPIIHNGKTLHFASRDNTYAYFRYTDDGAVFVFLNAAEQPRIVPIGNYEEILAKYNQQGVDILSGDITDLSKPFEVAPLSAIVVKINAAK